MLESHNHHGLLANQAPRAFAVDRSLEFPDLHPGISDARGDALSRVTGAAAPETALRLTVAEFCRLRVALDTHPRSDTLTVPIFACDP